VTKLEHSPLTTTFNSSVFCVFCRLQEQTIKQQHRLENLNEHEKSEENIQPA
jgi:hypothetical protein